MGAVYVKTSDEGPLREHLTPAERARLIELWYHPHHQRLTQTVDDVISDAKDCIIVDCDSFRRDRCLMNRTRTRFGRTSASEQTDGIHPTDCARTGRRVSAARGFSVLVDRPFAGALVPASTIGGRQRSRPS
jgi:N-formylglutamate deformylase